MKTFEEYAAAIYPKLEPPQISEEAEILPFDNLEGGLIDARIRDLTEAGDEVEAVSAAISSSAHDDLEDVDKSLLDGLVVEKGTDALAFYKSVRFKEKGPFKGTWGVFIFDFGIEFLAQEAKSGMPHLSRREHRHLAFLALKHHELFHFRVDVWALGLDAITLKSKYLEYVYNAYASDPTATLLYEEALANRNAINVLNRHGGYRWIKNFMRAQPGAYARFDCDRQIASASLAAQIVHGALGAGVMLQEDGFPHSPFIGFGNQDITGANACPLYLISGVSPKKVYPLARGLPALKEVRDIFVPAYLAGQSLRRTDHLFVQIDNGEQIKIPNDHRERLAPHEFKNILRKAGMRPNQFWDARESTQRWRTACPRSPVLEPLD